MRRTVIAGHVICVVLMGCAAVKPAPPRSAPTGPAVRPPEVAHTLPEDAVTKPSEPPGVSTPPQSQSAPVPLAPVQPGPTAAPSSGTETAAKHPPHKTSPSPPAVAKRPAVIPPAAPPEAPPPAVVSDSVKRAPPPSLDLASLEQRLRETHGIGLFTKLSLKNQVDDLLAEFRAYYQGTLKVPLAVLRQRYDLLLLKVLTLLQDGDPPLAATIRTSKEAIWGILADPKKFSSL